MTDPRDIVRQVSERWNAGDIDGLLAVYAEDVVVQTGEHWPEQAIMQGKTVFRESIHEWLDVWESIAVEDGPRGGALGRSTSFHGPGWEDRSC